MKKKLLLVLLFGLLVIPAFSDTIWVRYLLGKALYKYENMKYTDTKSLYAYPNTYTINSYSGILYVWDEYGIEHIYHSDWEIECK